MGKNMTVPIHLLTVADRYQDPMGKNMTVAIPERTVDRTQKMQPGMDFRVKHTYKKIVLNKWQARCRYMSLRIVARRMCNTCHLQENRAEQVASQVPLHVVTYRCSSYV